MVSDAKLSSRDLALSVLLGSERAHTDELLSAELGRSSLSAKDRQLATELVQGTLRWRGVLDFHLRRWFRGDYRRADPRLKIILRLGLYQLLYLDRVPDHAAVDSSVEMAKQQVGLKAARLVNAILRRAVQEKDSLPEPDQRNRLERISISTSHPSWLVRRWASRFGWQDTEALCRSNNTAPDLWLRWNPLKTDRQSFFAILEESGTEAGESDISSGHVLIKDNLDVSRLQLHHDGLCTVQDVSAGLPVCLLDPQPGEVILDFCAAPGGKTTQIAETMEDSGLVVAQDVSRDRIGRVRENLDRLGLTSVRCVVGDGFGLRTRAFDRILLDVPCSGLGVLRRRPDIRWKRTPNEIRFLVSIQSSILEASAPLVKDDGVIVYCTCTTEPEENWQQIDQFLSHHPEWRRDNAERWVSPVVVNPRGEIETYPHMHHMDGAYAVRLVRN